MKHYIKQTDGNLSNDKREEWEMAAVKDMVAHNNFAERPFAVVKAFARMYPSLSLQNLSHLTHSIVNGTHRCAEALSLENSAGPGATRLAGIALSASTALQKTVNAVCSVRRKSIGSVTRLCREAHKVDTTTQVTHRKEKAVTKYKALI